MFIHSVPSYIQPVTNTFRTARSSAANFGEQFVKFSQRLLVHFCHIPEDHSDESECIENLKLVQNLLSQNKLLSMNTKLGQVSKILTLRHPPKIEVSPA